jgi:hypothetical protein
VLCARTQHDLSSCHGGIDAKNQIAIDSFNGWRQEMPLVAGQRFEIALPGPADGPGTEPCLDLLDLFNALSLNKVNCETPWQKTAASSLISPAYGGL